MFKSILRSLGVGGASVETVLDSPEAVVGGRIAGEVRVTGGDTAQDIRGVVLEIVTLCRVETRGDDKVYAEISLGEARLDPGTIGPRATKTLPFQIVLPASTPLTVGSTSTVLRTRLDVAGAVDPKDADPVRVLPNRAMAAVLQGMERAGFRLVETEVEYNPRRANPFVQEFDFRPRSSRDWGIEEVEISFSPVQGGVEVALTVDNRGGFFALGRERTARFRVSEAQADRINLATELRRAIDSLR
ncbi:sporulation protein [Rubellimicrobium mesophilum]|uniref:sporulation protein n=1 Tax=Rubellimicrobium mesophilum TaxID=1123067 RepID=UPI0009E9B6E3|nr:sporulation protein [Rubellimicrobium mesophilum]